MKRERIGVLFLLTVLVLVFVMPVNVMAESNVYNLLIAAEDSFARPHFNHDGVCTPPDGFDGTEDGVYYYDTVTFIPSETAEYNINVTSILTTDGRVISDAEPRIDLESGDSVLYIYENSFDSSNPLTNLIAGNDDAEEGLLSSIPYFELTGGTTYIMVVSTYSSEVVGEAVLTIDNNPDTTPPEITYADIEYETETNIYITLSEDCTGIEKDNDGGFTVEKFGDPSTTYAVSAVQKVLSEINNFIVLTVEDFGMAGRDGLVVKYSPTGNGTIADTRAGNLMEAQQFTINAWDFEGPRIAFSGISANNSFIDMTFTEGVFGDAGASTPVLADGFEAVFVNDVIGDRPIEMVTISSIKKPDSTIEADASPLTGGETTIRIFITVQPGVTSNQGVYISIAGSTMYDKLGNVRDRDNDSDLMPFNEEGKVWIRFEENMGLEDLEDINAVPGTVITLPDESALTGDGKFWGWYVEKEGFFPKITSPFLPDYLPGDEYIVPDVGATLHAVWTGTTPGITMIMYFAGPGEGTSMDGFSEGTGTLSDGTGFVRNGWLIDGWSIDGTPHDLGAPAPAGEALTARAIWAEDANNNGIKDSEEAGNSDNPKTQDTSSNIWVLSLFALLAAVVVIKKKEITEQ